MGADLYIEPFFSENRDKYDALFKEAVKARDAYPTPDDVKGILSAEEFGMEITPEQMTIKTRVYPAEYQRAKELQAEVSKYYEKMYEVGYFRDSYNGSSLFWKLGLSWWAMANINGKPVKVQLIDKQGNISVKSSKLLLALVKSLPIQLDEKANENWEKGTTVEDVRKFFEAKKKRFEDFLQFAIDNKAKIRASV